MCDNIREAAPAAIGSQIRDLRRLQNLTLNEVAKRAGTSAPTLHRYESGWDRFEVATLRRIAAALDACLEIRLKKKSTPRRMKNVIPSKIIPILSPLFWDRDLTSDDFRDFPGWIMCRVLMYGNIEQVRAARAFFGDQALREALEKRIIDRRTRNFWNLYLGESENASKNAQ